MLMVFWALHAFRAMKGKTQFNLFNRLCYWIGTSLALWGEVLLLLFRFRVQLDAKNYKQHIHKHHCGSVAWEDSKA